MGTDLLRVEGNERVDLNDFGFLADESAQAAQRQLGGQFLTDPGGSRAWVLDGFVITNPSGTQIQVDKGRAILSQREGGQVFHGMVATEGDSSKVIDIGAFTPGTYGIFIRFEFVDSTPQSRIFWDATGLGTEFAQTIDTRRTANWSMRIELSSPGGEWLQIGTVNTVGTVITDQRPLYFEGQVDTTYANTWGTGTDRNADRQQYGVKDLQTFVAAMRQSLEDIKGRGLRRWWDAEIGGMRVGFAGDPTEGRIELGDANFFLDGENNVLGPEISFDSGDTFVYDRTSGTFGEYKFFINSALTVRWDDTRMILNNLYIDTLGVGVIPTEKFQVQTSGHSYGMIHSDSGTGATLGTKINPAGPNPSFGTKTNNDLGFFVNDLAPTFFLTIGEALVPRVTGINDIGSSTNRWGSMVALRGIYTGSGGSLSLPTNNLELLGRTGVNAVVAHGIFDSGTNGVGGALTMRGSPFNITGGSKNASGSFTLGLNTTVHGDCTVICQINAISGGAFPGSNPAIVIGRVAIGGASVDLRSYSTAGTLQDLPTNSYVSVLVIGRPLVLP